MYEEIYRIEPQNTINMLGESIIFKDRQLQLFQWLIDQARNTPSLSPTQAKELINLLQFVRDEKLTHSNILYNMYFHLTNAYPPAYDRTFYPPENILSGLERAILENLESAQKNRLIMNSLQSSDRFLMSSIISDEINHVDLLSYLTLFLKNSQT
ncbi:hypothetical protein [Metaclostridioides mangenotii]|uniref:hypothetical protein n=1 Tax=Metaclostridioides mangenotii TaxID=1540 RepID=UPI0028E5BED0|nr:hypothetical protein [Clostridioides mangenotii]